MERLVIATQPPPVLNVPYVTIRKIDDIGAAAKATAVL